MMRQERSVRKNLPVALDGNVLSARVHPASIAALIFASAGIQLRDGGQVLAVIYAAKDTA